MVAAATIFFVLIDYFSQQRGCGGVVYPYFYEITNPVFFSVEHRRAVLFGAAVELLL